MYQGVFFSSRRRHTRLQGDWSSDVCSSDLPSWMRNVFDDMGEDITLESFNAAMQTVELTGAAIEGWTRNITNFGKLGDEAIAKLIKSAGGIQDLIAGMDAFYTSFYSERERIENAAKARSEEHTSELQSPCNLVCRLLL